MGDRIDRVIARVAGIAEEEPGIQRLEIDGGTGHRAVCYTSLVGACAPGDQVILNCTATSLNLGTGGEDFVIAKIPADSECEGPLKLSDEPGIPAVGSHNGHIMKLRYTPLQRSVGCVEEPDSPHHNKMLRTRSLDGMPVVCCSLHSQVPLVAAGIRSIMPDAVIAYCMTDEGSLMAEHSRIVGACRDTGLLNMTITCGQASGGGMEAVTLHSGLLASRAVIGADVAIVSIGPGIAGTATPFGHGGVAQAEAVNAAGALGGKPVAVARISLADPRERHHGLSHHFLESMGTLTLAKCCIYIPKGLPDDAHKYIEEQLEASGISQRHDVVWVSVPDGPYDTRGIKVTTMGRSYEDDPWFFKAAYGAGAECASMVLQGVAGR